MLGTPLMPWQRQVCDVALEVDKTGRPYYREIIVQIPRQSGKTTLILALELHRALYWGAPTITAYSAQTGFDARKKLIDDQVPLIMRSPLAAAIEKVKVANGHESVRFRNGSRIDVMPTTPTAGHGRTITGLGVIDEAFAEGFEAHREGALLPAMATARDAQMLVVSTAGTQQSIYFAKKCELGRSYVDSGRTEGIAYFEWSADPEDDIDELATWERCMPALYETIPIESVTHARATLSEGDFRRSFLCQWTIGDERAIPEKLWSQIQNKETAPTGRLSFGIDVALDRSSSAIVVADETGRCELIEHRPGVNWVVDRALQLYRTHKGSLVVDGYSPANSLVDRLENGGVPVVRYGTRDMTSASGILHDAIIDKMIQVRPNTALDEAVAGAQRRQLGQAWLWSRSQVDVDLTPLFALTLAYHHSTNRQPQEKPRSKIF